MLTVLKLFGLILVFRCKPIKFIKKIDFWKINTITIILTLSSTAIFHF